MQIDLRTVAIEPKRLAFDHLARRFGANKQPSRYQEGSYDLQPTHNFHYRPSWDPQRELYDARRTAIVMADWYALKDPRQFYYGSYTQARARQQEAAEASFEFVESRGLAALLSPELRDDALGLLLPLRHVAWAADLNNCGICADGYGTVLTQAAMYHAMDNLGIAQYLTRLGLLLGDVESLAVAKREWLEAPRWQPLRRLVENLLVQRDWFELFVAQNLVLDGLLYPLAYIEAVDKRYPQRGSAAVTMLTAFMTDWFAETGKWVDAVVKTAAAESDANRALLSQWTAAWRDRALAALEPVAASAFGDDSAEVLATVAQTFASRAAKLGLTV
ncbi:aromatic/alkene monooxygenase hydroxylase subunit beta [Derxia gummosa]|uniref:Aromatic/alkene monooxygenase hydroxylase subunit beta n=1 Tax=Derxia gummosa DSM 723 TaxID=1121388 RepID=A0A8B6X400_9BURK|nr:aromatic/alkene monooxygenase hydroxylase subunit beta [Derxia gummosa]